MYIFISFSVIFVLPSLVNKALCVTYCILVLNVLRLFVNSRFVGVCAGDHVLLESQDFACVFNPKQITIRTRASEKESYDSAPVTLTPELLAEIRYRVRLDLGRVLCRGYTLSTNYVAKCL